MIRVTETKDLPEFFILIRSVEVSETVKKLLSEFYNFGDVYIFERGKFKLIALEILDGLPKADQVAAETQAPEDVA